MFHLLVNSLALSAQPVDRSDTLLEPVEVFEIVVRHTGDALPMMPELADHALDGVSLVRRQVAEPTGILHGRHLAEIRFSQRTSETVL